MARNNIYDAIVEDFTPTGVLLRLIDAPKCEGCAIASACGNRPSDRIVEVAMPEGRELSVGDRVQVRCPPSSQQRAMLWGIVVPCVVLIAVSLLMPLLGLSDSAVAACGLGSVAIYYCVLFLLRKSIDRRLRWTVV